MMAGRALACATVWTEHSGRSATSSALEVLKTFAPDMASAMMAWSAVAIAPATRLTSGMRVSLSVLDKECAATTDDAF